MEVMNQKSDKALLEAAHRGMAQPLEDLKYRYRPKMKSLLNKHLGSIKGEISFSLETLYPDFESEVWIKVILKPLSELKFDHEGSIGGLVHKITTNHFIDKYLGSEARRVGISLDALKKLSKDERAALNRYKINSASGDDEENEEDYFSYLGDQSSFLEDKISEDDFLYKIIDLLPQELRKVAYLNAWGFTQKEIANEIGMSDKTVRTYINKIKSLAQEAKDNLEK